MGNKRIEFERTEITAGHDRFIIDTGSVKQLYLFVEDHSGGCVEVSLKDPAKLDALAKAITDAAALRKSQTLTFADLKPGEFFQFAYSDPGDVCQRDSGVRYAWLKPHMDSGCTTAGHAEVVRVTVTPAPADEVGRG